MGVMEISIPIWQVCLFMLLISVFMLFGRLRLSLLTSYCFSFFWVFIVNKEVFTKQDNQTLYGMAFFVCGLLVIAFSIWSFFVETK
jgi:hypothetical protein